MNNRSRLLHQWAGYVYQAGDTLAGKPIRVGRIEGIAGPRAGALEIYAGLDAGRLLKALAANDAAILRQFIPWRFPGEPAAYMAGRCVRIEAGWPDHLAETMIRLADLGRYPHGDGRWLAGKNEQGCTIRPGLNDATPHFLVSGATGSGKSVALRSAVLQLSRDPDNRLVLIDGKYGESLGQVGHLRGVVGPVATEGPAVRGALGWACQEMRRRYEEAPVPGPGTGAVGQSGRLVVVFDEIQEFVGDPVIVTLMKRIAAQGRGAHVHLLAATQHPTVQAFGDAATRRNLTGKLALRVSDPDASRVAVGGRLPRADYLLGAGDAYTVAPGVVHRVQLAYVDGREIECADGGQYDLDEWPEYDAELVGRLPQPGRPRRPLSHGEIGAALVAAMEGEGRPALKTRIEAAGLRRPGSDRARALLTLGRKIVDWLETHDVGLYYLDNDGDEWDIETETD